MVNLSAARPLGRLLEWASCLVPTGSAADHCSFGKPNVLKVPSTCSTTDVCSCLPSDHKPGHRTQSSQDTPVNAPLRMYPVHLSAVKLLKLRHRKQFHDPLAAAILATSRRSALVWSLKRRCSASSALLCSLWGRLVNSSYLDGRLSFALALTS